MKTKKTTFKKLILDELKAMGRQDIASKITSITSSVYSGGSSIDVRAVNLFKAEREVLNALLDTYTDGDFDGMTDSYTYKETSREHTVKYAFLNNVFSEEIINAVKARLEKEYGITDNKSCFEKKHIWLDQAIHMVCVDLVDDEIVVGGSL